MGVQSILTFFWIWVDFLGRGRAAKRYESLLVVGTNGVRLDGEL
ncbi:hypothetical protein LX13_000599 [Williamsia maris]|uniref:Uncharacterized protein n=1 Tax=Williamsia maris TaxID=72806 RepID=A0ABT1H956_9NOCA|nr:hypothetical protein [Williamsia maris]